MLDSKKLICVAAAGLSLACGKPEEAAIKDPQPAPSSSSEISAGSLGGTLVDSPFSVQSARYSFDRRYGFEKVDISLSLGTVDAPCAEPKPSDASSIWIRRTGAGPIKPEVVRLSPKDDEGPWSVHYQVHDEHGWRGNGDASALIVIRGVGPDLKLTGELSACFADATGSCVSGRFTAEHCGVRLDAPVRGSEAMERLPARVRAAADAGADAAASGAADAGGEKGKKP